MNSEFTCVASILRHLERSDSSLCCHIGSENVFTVSESLIDKLQTSGSTARFANCFTPKPRWLNRIFPLSTVDWFSRTACCSRQTALVLIGQLPVSIHECLSYNAGNARCILAVAALAYTRPDFLIFTTSGMDPQGMQTLQSSVHVLCKDARAIHVCNLPDQNKSKWKCTAHPPMECVSCTLEKDI